MDINLLLNIMPIYYFIKSEQIKKVNLHQVNSSKSEQKT
jgi:hypothetical protein